MALVGVESVSKALVATEYDGYAVSEPVIQNEGEPDFTSIVGITAKYEFKSISHPLSVVDQIVTIAPLLDGDNIVIVKEDESIVEMMDISGVVSPVPDVEFGPNGAYISLHDDNFTAKGHHSGWSDSNVYLNQAVSDGDFYIEALLGYGGQNIMVGVSLNNTWQGGEIGYDNGDAVDVRGTSEGYYYATRYIADLGEVYFYRNGVSLGLAATYPPNTPLYFGFTVYDLDGYVYLRTNSLTIQYPITGSTPLGAQFHFLDTSVATQGAEIPLKAYAIDSALGFKSGSGYAEPTLEGDTYAYVDEVDTVETLKTTRTYQDLSVSGRKLHTKIKLKNIGDKCTEVLADIWRGD